MRSGTNVISASAPTMTTKKGIVSRTISRSGTPAIRDVAARFDHPNGPGRARDRYLCDRVMAYAP